MTNESAGQPKEFTLLHLGAMFAILAVIAAISLPPIFVPTGSREKARRANCMSNLKQLGLAIAMYAEADPYHRCPTDGDPPTLVGSLRLLSNVVSSTRILRCPSDWRARAEFDFDGMVTTNISYSYVPNLIWQDHPDSIVALDRIYMTQKGSKWPTIGNHHDTGGNILYGDGHVAWTNALPSTLKDKDGKEIVLSP
jgi:prepilin-type processing-associated H-X9-DG protein